MKVRLMLAVLLSVSYLSALGGEAAKLGTDKQKFSYAIGFQLGQNFKREGLQVDVEALSQAIRDVMAGAPPRLSDAEMQAALQAFQQKKAAEHLAAGKENRAAEEAFLAKNKTKEGVVILPSGLQYKVVRKGSGKSPTENDTVVINYRGSLINGQQFDSSYERGEPATFPVKGVIKGMGEALQLMQEGAQWQLFVPSTLAYGERGAGNTIGPNSTLIFDLELIKVK
jgi:FKBP-type peptidyl-prolyl cis-trans isomerases 1